MNYREDDNGRKRDLEQDEVLPQYKEEREKWEREQWERDERERSEWDRSEEEMGPELREEIHRPEMEDMEKEIREFVYRQGILNGALEVDPSPSPSEKIPSSVKQSEVLSSGEIRRLISDATNAQMGAYIRDEKKKQSLRRRLWILTVVLFTLIGFVSGYALYMLRWNYVEEIERGLNAFSQKYESEISAQKLSMNVGNVKDVYKATLPSVVAVKVKTYGVYEGLSNGTGFVVAESEDHFDVVTNYHVIENFTSIELEYLGQHELGSAEIVGSDAVRDIALLRIKKENIKPEILAMIKVIPVADSSKVEVGEQVMALGNPLGYANTATLGIVSAVDRRVDSELLAKYIQTDAAINPGNSGGPLVNMKGELIGVNTVKVGGRSRIEGIGFAIPSNTVMKLVNQISDKGFADRPLLGIAGREFQGLNVQGVTIMSVMEDTPAARAGLQEGDIIVAIDGFGVFNVMGLNTYLAELDLGAVIKITYLRGNEEHTVDVKLDTPRGRE